MKNLIKNKVTKVWSNFSTKITWFQTNKKVKHTEIQYTYNLTMSELQKDNLDNFLKENKIKVNE